MLDPPSITCIPNTSIRILAILCIPSNIIVDPMEGGVEFF
jgi:hypothetical protein